MALTARLNIPFTAPCLQNSGSRSTENSNNSPKQTENTYFSSSVHFFRDKKGRGRKGRRRQREKKKWAGKRGKKGEKYER